MWKPDTALTYHVVLSFIGLALVQILPRLHENDESDEWICGGSAARYDDSASAVMNHWFVIYGEWDYWFGAPEFFFSNLAINLVAKKFWEGSGVC